MKEIALDTASKMLTIWERVENWAFRIVVVALAVEFIAHRLGAPYRERLDAARELRIAELNNETERLRNLAAPRTLSQHQQDELSALLKGNESLTGTVVASPSTSEAEMFARVLAAPLLAAGWKVTVSEGTATATMLFPKGVVVGYRAGPNIDRPPEPPAAVARLVDFLSKAGIGSTAVPYPTASDDFKIIINAK